MRPLKRSKAFVLLGVLSLVLPACTASRGLSELNASGHMATITQVDMTTLGELTAGVGITLEAGAEILGVPKVLVSSPVIPATADGALFTVPAGEVWIVHDIWIQTTADWDGNGVFTIGDGNDPDGFLAPINADLDPTRDESAGVTGWTPGSFGLIHTARGVYLWDTTNDSDRMMQYRATDTIDVDVTVGTSTVGSTLVYLRYTRIS